MTRSAVGVSVSAVAALLLLAGTASADQLAGTVAKLDAPRAQLDRAATNAVPGGGQIRHYQQKVGGLPVFGAEAVVVVPAGSDSIVVSDTTARWRQLVGCRRGDQQRQGDRRGAFGRRASSACGPRPAQSSGSTRRSGDLIWQVSLPAGQAARGLRRRHRRPHGREAALQGRAQARDRRSCDLQPEPGRPAGRLLRAQGQERQGHVAAHLAASCRRASTGSSTTPRAASRASTSRR